MYKLRVRENKVNIHDLVDEHYERYVHVDQKEEYEKEMSLSI